MARPDPEFALEVVDWSSNEAAYGNVPVDAADPRHRDPLVSIEEYSIADESFYSPTDGNNWPYCVSIDGSRYERDSTTSSLGGVATSEAHVGDPWA